MHGPLETGLPAEGSHQFDRRAEAVERWDLQNVDVVEIEHSLVGVLVEQRVEHGAGLTRVSVEHVPLLDAVGSLAAGQRLGVKGDVTDEIKGVQILAQLLDDHSQREPFGRHLVDDRLLAFLAVPPIQEVVQAGETPAQRPPREVTERLGDELALSVEVLHPFGDNGGLDAINIDLLPWPGRWWPGWIPAINDDLALAGSVRTIRWRIGRKNGIVWSGLVDLLRLAVELRVREMTGGPPEVDRRPWATSSSNQVQKGLKCAGG